MKKKFITTWFLIKPVRGRTLDASVFVRLAKLVNYFLDTLLSSQTFLRISLPKECLKPIIIEASWKTISKKRKTVSFLIKRIVLVSLKTKYARSEERRVGKECRSRWWKEQ